ncbi:MAG: hypothetical protein EOO46_08045 [Flavobacterium sp.]|nr:MAG: hypothetical protein EOO46_08045 [Flavobacterium sp.]
MKINGQRSMLNLLYQEVETYNRIIATEKGDYRLRTITSLLYCEPLFDKQRFKALSASLNQRLSKPSIRWDKCH